MRKLNIIKQFNQAAISKLGILSNVEQLTSFDMIYIYHHFQEGAELQIVPEHQHYLYQHPMQVFYKGFKIGYLSDRIASIVAAKLKAGIEVTVRIKQLNKRKYLPLSGLDVEVIF